MRTAYFKEISLGDENIKNLQKLASLSKESANSILVWLEEVKEVYPRFDRTDMAKIADITGESATTLVGPLNGLRLFIDRIIDSNDDVEAFYADLKDLKVIEDKTGYKTLDLIFSRLPAIIGKFRLLNRCKITERLGSPVLMGSGMTATLKPIFPRKFQYGKDSIEQYKPKPIAYCVVAQIELQNSGSEYTFSFQLNGDNFDRFLNDLLALQAEMRILEEQAKKMNSDLCGK